MHDMATPNKQLACLAASRWALFGLGARCRLGTVLSEQLFRLDKWNVCRVQAASICGS